MKINWGTGIVLAFIAFLAVCIWAYSSKRKAGFEEAANLPFADDTDAPVDAVRDSRHQ